MKQINLGHNIDQYIKIDEVKHTNLIGIYNKNNKYLIAISDNIVYLINPYNDNITWKFNNYNSFISIIFKSDYFVEEYSFLYYFNTCKDLLNWLTSDDIKPIKNTCKIVCENTIINNDIISLNKVENKGIIGVIYNQSGRKSDDIDEICIIKEAINSTFELISMYCSKYSNIGFEGSIINILQSPNIIDAYTFDNEEEFFLWASETQKQINEENKVKDLSESTEVAQFSEL